MGRRLSGEDRGPGRRDVRRLVEQVLLAEYTPSVVVVQRKRGRRLLSRANGPTTWNPPPGEASFISSRWPARRPPWRVGDRAPGSREPTGRAVHLRGLHVRSEGVPELRQRDDQAADGSRRPQPCSTWCSSTRFQERLDQSRFAGSPPRPKTRRTDRRPGARFCAARTNTCRPPSRSLKLPTRS